MRYRMREMLNKLELRLETKLCRRCLERKAVVDFANGSDCCERCAKEANKKEDSK